MEKKASTKHTIHPLLEKRWSPRSFSVESIDIEKIKRIFEAARWSSSSFNEQPWRYMVGIKTKGETYDKIYKTLAGFNQQWAIQAPLLVLCCAKKHFTQRDANNEHYKYDIGQSVANLIFQANYEDLMAHQMAGFNQQMAVELFNIPIDFVPITVIALGYEGDPETLPEEIKKLEYAERVRNELNTFIFEEKFGNKASFL